MLLMVQTGLRVSELIGLCRNDIHLGAGAHVACHGKGRKDRITPLAKPTIDALRDWMTESPGQPTDPVFPTRTGDSLSRDAVEHRLARHQATAALTCPSLDTKHITAHVLRHTAAMRLLEAGVDTTVIALWLGHEQSRHHRDLPARPPRHQGKSPRPHHAPRTSRPDVTTHRRATGVPRRTLIMPTSAAPPSPPPATTPQDRHNPNVGVMELMPMSA